MKTAIQTLLEEVENYKKESGNNSIDIELLKQGINGIYSSLEKQQIIEAYKYAESVAYADTKYSGEEYYNEHFN